MVRPYYNHDFHSHNSKTTGKFREGSLSHSWSVQLSTFGSVSLCLGVVLQLEVAGGAVAVEDSAVCLAVTQLQSFGVAADRTMHVSCLEEVVALLLQGRRVLGG